MPLAEHGKLRMHENRPSESTLALAAVCSLVVLAIAHARRHRHRRRASSSSPYALAPFLSDRVRQLVVVEEAAPVDLSRSPLTAHALSPRKLLGVGSDEAALRVTRATDVDEPAWMARAARVVRRAAAAAPDEALREDASTLAPRAAAALALMSTWRSSTSSMIAATQLLLAEIEVCVERAHGLAGGGAHAKVKDILANEAVLKLLGEPLVLVLRVLIGPLHGIGLRNLCWHGYLTDTDLGAHWPALLCCSFGTSRPPAAARRRRHRRRRRRRHSVGGSSPWELLHHLRGA